MSSPEPKPKRQRHYGRWLVLTFIVIFAWCGWRVWDEKQAGKEALALGWTWRVAEPIEVIRRNWMAAFRKATWLDGQRRVWIPSAEEYDQHRDLVHRLRPRQLSMVNASKWHDLSALKGLVDLQAIRLTGCPGLTNIDALKGLSGLQSLRLSRCTRLSNVDALKGLSELKVLILDDCTGLENVDALNALSALEKVTLDGCAGLTNVEALKGLTALQSLYLTGCTGLTNVDALKELSSLQLLQLTRCTGLTKETVDALRAALPKTKIYGP